jgi:hypothetical protein
VGRDTRACPSCVVLVAVLVLGTGTSAFRVPTTEGSSRDSEFTLHIRLTVANDLPSSARARLTQEAEVIWRREGLRLQRVSGADKPPSSGLALSVLVGRLLRNAGDEDVWPVGRLLPDQSGGRIAIASITAAQRVLASAGFGIEPITIREHRLGLILGRAVAHEIGHYLLGTRSHARHGLMRGQIDTRDFADLRNGGFFLDGVASRWIRDALTRGAISSEAFARFEY